MTEKNIFKKTYWGMVQAENFLGHFLLLIIRLYWGMLFISIGFGKWMHLHEIANYFNSLNIPAPLFITGLVATIEFLGGISLILGFGSRIFSLVLLVILASAYGTAHKESVTHFFSNPANFVQQEPFLFLYTCLVILCFGPGLFSIDYWLERKVFGHKLK